MGIRVQIIIDGDGSYHCLPSAANPQCYDSLRDKELQRRNYCNLPDKVSLIFKTKAQVKKFIESLDIMFRRVLGGVESPIKADTYRRLKKHNVVRILIDWIKDTAKRMDEGIKKILINQKAAY
jgi:hypothetical protein